LILILLHTIFVKAWQTDNFTLETIARMATMINFVTTILTKLNAGLISADMLKCGFWEGG
jgi:hypothetical protein